MNRTKIFVAAIIILIAAVLLARVVNKYTKKTETKEAAAKVSYWTCGMHPSVHSNKPGKCPICGMDLIPVMPAQETPESEQTTKRAKHEYYGCGVKEEGHCPHCDEGKPDAECICGSHSFAVEDAPMNCPVCSKPLKKLGPEEIKRIDKAVVSRVKLNKELIERAGIVIEEIKRLPLTKTIRTVGKIAFDPELAVAEEEFLTALETREKLSKSTDIDVIERAENLVNKSKIRLRLLGLSDEQIEELEDSRATQTNLLLPEDKAWVYADIYEYDIGWVKMGEPVKVISVAYPGEEFKGTIKAMNPVLDPATRSTKIRIEVDNPNKKLKPEMYVDVIMESVYIAPDGTSDVLVVPKEALLDTGARKIVYVQQGEGEYLGKEVKVGPEGTAVIDGKEIRLYPILSGLREDDLIVRKGNFLIDSQSQLTSGMSVLWAGSQEIKAEGASSESERLETKHRH